MNISAPRYALVTACLVGLTGMAYAETEPLDPDLQLPKDYIDVTGELLNKDYDQGVIRNNDVTAHGNVSARFFDFGVHLDDYTAVGSDPTIKPNVKSGETTQMVGGIDYLIEYTNLFQILPHYQYITYPNIPKAPYKDEQNYIGVDGWYELPVAGVEVGAGFDYDPFYNGTIDKYRAGGSLETHILRDAIGAREFFQGAPVDLAFWQAINLGNSEYKKFLDGNAHTGFTTLDLGVMYTSPFYKQDLWTVVRLEFHYWLDKKDRDILHNAGQETTDVILGIGLEWKPQ
jgi:hypothetical protein